MTAIDGYWGFFVISGLVAGYFSYQYHQYRVELAKPKIEEFVRFSTPGNLRPSPPSFLDWLLE
jgi:hypothetical protein